TPAKRDIGRPRLPIDRAFTIAGFGTVVTGTLIAGSLRVGQEGEVAPRVRRTALNLAGIAVEELQRGMVVASPGWLRPATSLDVRLRAVRYLTRPLRHNTTVTLHTGSAEGESRLLPLATDHVPP